MSSKSDRAPGFVSNTTYGHDSYLATMEDAFGLPRLPTTVGSTSMADFFVADPWSLSDPPASDASTPDPLAPAVDGALLP